MSRMKFFEVAKELGWPTAELWQLAHRRSLGVTKSDQLLSAAQETQLRALVAENGGPRDPAPKRAPAPVAAVPPAPETGGCACCKRPRATLAKARTPNGLPQQIRICVDCQGHQGHSPKAVDARDAVHARLWKEALGTAVDLTVARFEILLAQAREQVEAKQRELDARPERVVNHFVGQDKIDEAAEKAAAAYRSRESAFQALCLVRLQHRDAGSGKCRCGVALDRCPTFEVVAGYPALEKWERDQFDRFLRGMPCSLPYEHPARLDHRWRPAGWDEGDETIDLDELEEFERQMRQGG